MKRTSLLLVVQGLTIPVLSAPTVRLWLAWDAPQQKVDAFCIYEGTGTNRVKIGTTTNKVWQIDAAPGVHVYSVTCSNLWGESPPATIETPDIAPTIERLTISR